MAFSSSCFSELAPWQPWFELPSMDDDEGGHDENDQPVLDVRASFSPTSWWAILSKLVCFGYVTATQICTWVMSQEKSFIYAYFTNWSMLVSFIYVSLSLVNSLFPLAQPVEAATATNDHKHKQQQQEEPAKIIPLSLRIKATWFFCIMALGSGAITTVFYWGSVLTGNNTRSISYLFDVAPHGLIFCCVFLDGLHINRIPLYWRHVWAIQAMIVLFILWTVMHSPVVLDVGNPYESDDALYPGLAWTPDDTPLALVMCVSVLGVVMPGLWGLLRVHSQTSWLGWSPFAQSRLRWMNSTDNEQHLSSSEITELFDDPSSASVHKVLHVLSTEEDALPAIHDV